MHKGSIFHLNSFVVRTKNGRAKLNMYITSGVNY